jgi:hypothetical protein
MERGRRSYTGSILGEEGIRGLMEWRGEEEAIYLRYSRRGGYRRIYGVWRGKDLCWRNSRRRIDGLGKKEGRRSYILYVGGILGGGYRRTDGMGRGRRSYSSLELFLEMRV